MMTQPIIFALTAGAGNALVGLLGKHAERAGCRPAVVPVLFLGTVALSAALALPFAGGRWGDPWLWALAVGMGVLYVAAMQSMLLANRCCPPSLVWSLANLALVVPIVLAPMLLSEPWKPIDALVITAFLAMLGLFRQSMQQTGEAAKAPWSQIWFPLTGVFLSNGLLMLGYKVKTQQCPQVGALPFLVLVFGAGALLGLLPALRARSPIARAEWQWAPLMGLAAAVANFSILGAVVLPAVMAFPLVQGTALIGGSLLMIARFGEPLNPAKIGGLCCGGAMIALAMLRG